MSTQLITIIPAIISMAWAIGLKHRERKFAEAAYLSFSAVCIFINAYLVYKMIISDISVGLHMVQMAACSCIIPLMHMYFAVQMGQSMRNKTTTLLWVLAALSFIPGVVVYNPFEPFIYPESGFKPFAFYIISKGEKAFAIFTGDLMVALQAVVIMLRSIPFAQKLRNFNLQLNPKIYAFGAWWTINIIAIVIISGMTYADLRSPVGTWFYFLTYSTLVTTLNTFIILRFDLHPVETHEGESIENFNLYVQQQFCDMAAKMKEIVEENKFYLNPDCTAENMVSMLGTNRTYFTQMMADQLGMTFSEYVGTLRMNYVEELLRTTKLTVTEIAFQCGYSEPGYMSRKFKEKYGASPTEWRKNNS